MRYTIHIISLIVALVGAQPVDDASLIGDLFPTEKSDDFMKNYVEVTTPKGQSYGALEKCGEGSSEGVNICVPYHLCDGVTKTVIEDGSTNGFGLIDIRFGGECEHYLDVCCGLNKKDDMKNPNVTPEPSVDPLKPTSTSTTTTARPVTSSTTMQPTPRPSSIKCGIRNPNGIDFKITGNNVDPFRDNEAEYGELPWMIAVLRTNYQPSKNESLALCGGSLIAPNVVLTGAHCVANLQLDEYKVRAGEWDTQTEKERLPHQERAVIQAIIHEKYAPNVLYNNIALLILDKPFNQADNIGTICLPSQNENIDSRKCLASGWGKNVFGLHGSYQVILKKIELPMVSFQQCQSALQTTRLGKRFNLHSSFTCAGGEQGKDTCTGDGGSPLVCPDSTNRGRYVQSGIVSWGIGCGEENIPGVYANVAKFRNWIDDKLSRLNINSNYYTI
ncbi:phenoloxidase-activating factor 2 isoform X1 [Dendroctonus ponderosae]|uniref:phenoloxidase-activating factor 2 isoform X1 n=1 Tax=Dendroctonus ponderosae TaxID=77166 RepID=UPI0020352462|nr:phenoloxidase-activating factor 2 isoform X1 [Dendroctonus ponderosae]